MKNRSIALATGELIPIVVGNFKSNSDENKSIVKKVLSHHNVELFAQDEIGDLVGEILSTGKDKQ